MSPLNLVNAEVIFPGKEKVDLVDVIIEEGSIQSINKSEGHKSGASEIDLNGYYLSPGFIDLQVNGGAGVDFLTCEQNELTKASKFWLEHGTTSFLGTIITQPTNSMNEAIEKLARSNMRNLLGVHVEGPFLSQDKRGTHNSSYLLESPNKKTFEEIIGNCEESVSLFTFAPELENSSKLLNWIESIEAIPSIGHTAASYATVQSFLDRGVSSFTHIFNGMKGFHHREPGTAGAALDSDAWVGAVCDGLHLHRGAVRLVNKAKNPDKICLVSDAIAAVGMQDGKYALGDQIITVKDGLAKLKNGTIAGSTLTLNEAVRNYVNFTDSSLLEAVKAVTVNPARLLGVEDTLGTMKIESKADFVVFDQDLKVKYTIINGEVVFESQ